MNFRLYEGIAEVGKDRSYGCWMKIESSCKDRQKQGFVAGFTLFHTRIKGLTRIVWLPKIGKQQISKS